jgi:hypothetical protein
MYEKGKKSRAIDTTALIICITLFAFVPFSFDGKILDLFLVKNLFTIIFVLFYGLYRGNIIMKQLFYILLIHLILLIFTLTSLSFTPLNYKVDYASYSVLVALSILWAFKFNDNIYSSSVNAIFNVMNVVLLTWSLGIIFDITWVKSFTLNYYSQFADYTLPNMLDRNKPVLSFGTHSISSYATIILFLLNYITVKIRVNKKNVINYVFMWLYLFTNIMTLSNTSFIASIVMLILLLNINKKKNLIKTTIILIIIIIVIFSVIGSGLLDQYVYRLFNQEHNGFIARYFGDLYSANFEFIRNYGGLGILSDINNKLFLIDSGFLVLLTRGNLIIVIFFFLCLYKFMLKNFGKKYVFYLFLPVFSFEIAASLLLLDVRPIYMLLMSIIYLNSLKNMEELDENNEK